MFENLECCRPNWGSDSFQSKANNNSIVQGYVVCFLVGGGGKTAESGGNPIQSDLPKQAPCSGGGEATELHGEFTKYVGRAEDAVIVMYNFHLSVKFKESIVNVTWHLQVSGCQRQEWLKRLSLVARPPSQLEELFAFAFHAWSMDFYSSEKAQHNELCMPDFFNRILTVSKQCNMEIIKESMKGA
ncbi:myotubularin-related protein 3 isoform X1, partial [Clarias magur]